MNFKDHFSGQAREYARFRPRYPRALFEFIAAQAPDDEQALDCATGNGQAAVALAEFFKKVIAIDASAAQIASAEPNARVEYHVACAEATALPDHCCAAITVAQAIHWLDLDRFYREVRRVLIAGGVLAFWAYNYLRLNADLEAIIRYYHDELVGPYWPPERKMVGRGYLELAFPFEEIAHPSFQIEAHWTLDDLVGYLCTWSATQRYQEAKRSNPLEVIISELERAWGNPAAKRLAVWPLTLRIGRA